MKRGSKLGWHVGKRLRAMFPGRDVRQKAGRAYLVNWGNMPGRTWGRERSWGDRIDQDVVDRVYAEVKKEVKGWDMPVRKLASSVLFYLPVEEYEKLEVDDGVHIDTPIHSEECSQLTQKHLEPGRRVRMSYIVAIKEYPKASRPVKYLDLEPPIGGRRQIQVEVWEKDGSYWDSTKEVYYPKKPLLRIVKHL